MVDAVPDRPGLVELRGPEPVVEPLRYGHVPGQAGAQLFVSVQGFLVMRDAGRVRGGRVVGDRRAQRRVGRWRLVPELGDDPRPVRAVVRVVVGVPHGPDVRGAVARIVGVPSRTRVRAAWPVRPGRVEFGDDAREHVEVVARPPRTAGQLLLPAPGVEAPDVLVVAGPQDEAGMAGQAGQLFARLGGHLGGERLLLRVRGAGEEEVLPDEEPEFVGEVVEVLALVDPAAPDPQIVDVRVGGLGEPGFVAVPGHPAGERVVGDPVGAAYEHGYVVDHDGERRAVGVRGGVQAYRPEADLLRPAVQRAAVARLQGEVEVVARLVAVPPGEPARRVADLEADDGLGVYGDLGVCAADAGDHGERRVPGALDRDVDLDLAVHSGQWADLGDSCGVPGVQPDGAPDSGGDQRRSPVPAEVARHLADVLVRLGIGSRPGAER